MIKINVSDVIKTLNNTVQYSQGFLEGAEGNQIVFNKIFGEAVIKSLEYYIDANARANPEALHHVYEWDYVGNPNGRLFNFDLAVTKKTISISSIFLQSETVQKDGTSSRPFYDKATVMEEGLTVIIMPRQSDVLAFNDDGQLSFSKGPIIIDTPGGNYVQGGFASAVKSFFDSYYEPGFLKSSGILDNLRNAKEFTQFFSKQSTRSTGRKAGMKYMTVKGGFE